MTKYSIVGQKHCKVDPYLTGTLPGTPVVLVRDPDNPVDKNAVQVWIDGKRVGYIPMKQNRDLAAHIDRIGWPWTDPSARADDAHGTHKAVDATFVRSPNSSYPMVEVN